MSRIKRALLYLYILSTLELCENKIENHSQMVIRCKMVVDRSEISPNRISSDIVKVVIHYIFFRLPFYDCPHFFLSSGEIDFLTGGLDGNSGTGRKVDLVISGFWGHGASSTYALLGMNREIPPARGCWFWKLETIMSLCSRFMLNIQ